MKHCIKALPGSAAGFQTMLHDLENTPEGAVFACIAALNILAADPEEGKKALVLFDPEIGLSRIQLAEMQMERAPYLMGSYFSGTGPENGYRIPETLEMELTTNRYSGSEGEGSVKFFVRCSGSSSPRPVTVHQRPDGTWYAHEWSSLIVGIAAPE